MKLSKYDFTIIMLWILSIIGIATLCYNQAWIWLLPLWIMTRINHVCLSLNHRMITHRAFQTSWWKRNLVILSSVFQVNHSPLRYAVLHRHHHVHSDEGPSDIHGPMTGLWNTFVGWEFGLEAKVAERKIKIPRDLVRDKFLMWFDKHYYSILFGTFALIFLINSTALWYVFIPAALIWRLEANILVNWCCHKYGYTNYELGTDKSKNNIWVGFWVLGEGWHNNHHAKPSEWQIGQRWWEIDIPAWIIKRLLITKE